MSALDQTRYRILPERPLQIPPNGRVEFLPLTESAGSERQERPTHAQAVIYDAGGVETTRILCRLHDLAAKITVVADGVTWLAVLGNCQLALRHPQNQGASTALARNFVAQLGEQLVLGNILSAEEWEKASQQEAELPVQPAKE